VVLANKSGLNEVLLHRSQVLTAHMSTADNLSSSLLLLASSQKKIKYINLSNFR